MSFFLILRNALRISAVSIVSQAVLLVNKVFITVASTTTGYYYLETYYGDQLNSLMVPTLIIAICSYAVSEMFDEVFGMVSCLIQTISRVIFPSDDSIGNINNTTMLCCR